MSNFENLINDQFKSQFTTLITEVICASSVPCQIIFGVTRYLDCGNCEFDPIGNKSSNRWQTGGPMPFSIGTCPMCGGVGKIPDEQIGTLDLAPIYDYRDWINLTSNIESPEGFVQTLSLFNTYSVLKQAKELIVNTNTTQYVKSRFERYGEPEPCGMGAASFITTMWKRIEN